jgi:hypothetical protein
MIVIKVAYHWGLYDCLVCGVFILSTITSYTNTPLRLPPPPRTLTVSNAYLTSAMIL